MSHSTNPLHPAPALPRRVRIGTSTIDLATLEVWADGQLRTRLTPKAGSVLRVLLQHEGAPVHRELLISSVWPGQFPTDDVVTKAIRELRRALSPGDEGDEPQVIATLPRIGYLLKLPASSLDDEAQPPAQINLSEAVVTRPRFSPSLVGFAFVTLLGLCGAVWWSWQRSMAPPSLASQDTSTAAPLVADRAFAPQLEIQPFTADPGDEGAADVSDDGLLVAFSSLRDGRHYRIYVRSVDGLSERRLTQSADDENELQPVFAPDGQQLAYQVLSEGQCSLRLIGLNGGSARTLSDCAMGLLVQMEFSRDGTHLLVPNVGRFETGTTGLRKLDLNSGAWSTLDYPIDPQSPDVEARYSPDGQWLLVRRGAAPHSQLWLHQVKPTDSMSGASEPRLMHGIHGLIRGTAWLPDSRNVVFASDAAGSMELWRLDTQSGFIERFGGVAGAFPSVAARVPVLVTRHVQRASSLQAVRLDGALDAGATLLFASNRSESWPSYSPDGTQLAFVSDRSGSHQIYLGTLKDQSVQRISQLNAGKPFALNFAPDGRQIAFSLRLLNDNQVGVVDLEGRWTRILETGLTRPERLRFAPDGALWLDAESSAGVKLHRLSSLDAVPEPLLVGGCSGRAPHALADGRVLFQHPGYQSVRLYTPSATVAGSGECRTVTRAIGWSSMDSWAVHQNAIFALLSHASGNAVHRIELDGSSTMFEPLGEHASLAAGIAIHPHVNQAVLGIDSEGAADLLLVRGF